MDLLLLFLKNALLSLLFHSKMSFMRKNPDFFPRSLRSLKFDRLSYDFFQGARCKTSFFLVLTQKGSLFSLYYCHSYYPAYLVWNLFTHCDKFCTWKSPTIPSFFTTIIPTFSLLFPNFYHYFFVGGYLKAWGLKSKGVICISIRLVGGSPLTLASQQVVHVPIK